MIFQGLNLTVYADGLAVDARITSFQILNTSNQPVTETEKSATLKLDFNFEMPESIFLNNGNYFDIKIPEEFDLTTAVTYPTTFDIKDEKTNEVIAHATVDKDNKKISLTYTDYAEKHSDTHGNFYFYARIDFKKHPQQGEIPVEVTVNNKTTIAGKVTFKGVGDGDPNLLKKTSWVHSDDPKTISYTISVNQLKQNIKEVTVECTDPKKLDNEFTQRI